MPGAKVRRKGVTFDPRGEAEVRVRRRGNPLRARPFAEHRLASPSSKAGVDDSIKGRIVANDADADQRAAYLRGGRLHRDRTRSSTSPSSRARSPRTTSRTLTEAAREHELPAAHLSVVFTDPQVATVGSDRAGSPRARRELSRGELSVRRPRQVAHHGSDAMVS